MEIVVVTWSPAGFGFIGSLGRSYIGFQVSACFEKSYSHLMFERLN